MSSTNMLYGSLIRAAKASRARRIQDDIVRRHDQDQAVTHSRPRRRWSSFES
jgi:hypothetical protein